MGIERRMIAVGSKFGRCFAVKVVRVGVSKAIIENARGESVHRRTPWVDHLDGLFHLGEDFWDVSKS